MMQKYRKYIYKYWVKRRKNEYANIVLCVAINSAKLENGTIKLKSRVLKGILELCQSYWIVQIAIQIYTI